MEKWFSKSALLLLLICCLSACASKDNHPIVVEADIVARRDANLDDDHEPSPVVVRLYQLTDVEAFQAASFEHVASGEFADNDDWVVSAKKMYISPGRIKSIQYEIQEPTKYIGVVAGLRNPNAGAWREVVAIPEDGVKKHKISVLVHSREVTLTLSKH